MNTNTWTGRPVNETFELYKNLDTKLLPTFRRKNFKNINGDSNPYLDVIVNEQKDMPVATVSKSYGLLQHTEAVEVTIDALSNMGFSHKDAHCELAMTDLGERMWLRIRFPQHHFDPGDEKPMMLELSLFNSVDRSLVFGFEGGWYREICKNGMVALNVGTRINRRHSKAFSADFLAQQLDEKLVAVLSEEERYKEWAAQNVTVGESIDYDSDISIEKWVDETITKEWGKRTAARVYNIIRTGIDGKANITEANTGKLAHVIPMRAGTESAVPGQNPTETLLDINHALTWITSHQETVQTHYEMMRDVPSMINTLALAYSYR